MNFYALEPGFGGYIIIVKLKGVEPITTAKKTYIPSQPANCKNIFRVSID